MESSYKEYWLIDDPVCIDVDIVCELLRDTYWAVNRSREQIALSIRNSLCFSVHVAGQQVGIARVLTDRGASSYICDVVIHPEHRSRGVGKWLMSCILQHPTVSETRALLITRDAQQFYREFGFVTHPFECMVRAKPTESSARPRGLA